MRELKEVVIAAYGRSGIGKAVKGSLAKANPVDFGAEVLRGVLNRIPELDPSQIDDVITGCANPEGRMGLNPSRNIVLRAELPERIPGQTVNRFCSSGLQSIANAAAMIMSGMQDIVVAGGVESMTDPVFSGEESNRNPWLINNTKRYTPMGITAENVAEKYGITREEADEFSCLSQQRANKAQMEGLFDKEIIPVTGYGMDGETFKFERDEGVRPGTTPEILGKLSPVFKQDGVVTAGNSSQRSDGASFIVLMSREKAEELAIRPVASFVSFAVDGLDPAYMGLGPIYAVDKLMKRTGMSVRDMDVIELNEAFATQSIQCIRTLGLDIEKVNPRGGAIALGHPLGATGGVLMCKALNYLECTKGEYGLITMCIGGGMGAAGIIKMI